MDVEVATDSQFWLVETLKILLKLNETRRQGRHICPLSKKISKGTSGLSGSGQRPLLLSVWWYSSGSEAGRETYSEDSEETVGQLVSFTSEK